jgi:hypothetical protein
MGQLRGTSVVGQLDHAAFGGLGHLLRRHVAACLSITSFATLSASRRVA